MMLGLYPSLYVQWPFQHCQKIVLQMVKKCRSFRVDHPWIKRFAHVVIVILCKSMIRNQVTWTPKILRPRDDMSMCACCCGQYARRGILEASHWELAPRARPTKVRTLEKLVSGIRRVFVFVLAAVLNTCCALHAHISQLLLLGKFEYGGGPIFKVVLEC